MAWEAASKVSVVIFAEAASSKPRKIPGNAKTFLI